MDDITGASSPEKATILRNQLVDLLRCGGFELRKWTSNHPHILTDIPKEHKETPLFFHGDDLSVKILGMHRNPKGDSFKFHFTTFQGAVTKRNI